MKTSEILSAALPLTIENVFVNDPMANLYGDEWSLYLGCPFVFENLNGENVFSNAEDDLLPEHLKGLVGLQILSFTSSGNLLVNPIFHLTGDVDLHIYADTDWDPWFLSLPSITIVGVMPQTGLEIRNDLQTTQPENNTL